MTDYNVSFATNYHLLLQTLSVEFLATTFTENKLQKIVGTVITCPNEDNCKYVIYVD